MRGQRVPVRSVRAEVDRLASAGERGHLPEVRDTGDADPLAQFKANVRQIKLMEEFVLVSKQRDYGPSNIADAPGGPLIGLAVRLHDKISRLNHLLSTGADPQHESIHDTLLDIANYGTIGQMVLSGYWPGVPEPEQGAGLTTQDLVEDFHRTRERIADESAFRKQYAPTPSFPGPVEPLPFPHHAAVEDL